MNLIMRGIHPDNIRTRNADTLEDDWPYFDGDTPYEPLLVDAVVSNPPYSQEWNRDGKEADPRYSFGLAPEKRSEYAFLLQGFYHLKHGGVMAIVLPHGVLFREDEEGMIRRNLLENGFIDAVVGLPADIFFGTGISAVIMVLKKDGGKSDVFVVDASNGFAKAKDAAGKATNVLRACDIKKIADAVNGRKSIPKFSRLVPLDEIRANGYNLNISRYVDSSPAPDMRDILSEFEGGVSEGELAAAGAGFWEAFPSLKDALFVEKDAGFFPRGIDVDSAVRQSPGFAAFASSLKGACASFGGVLYRRLVEGALSVDISRAEEELSGVLFSLLENIPLVDKYAAYQILHGRWESSEDRPESIAEDLEILQTEGFCSAKTITEGAGRLFPFALVQKAFMPEAQRALEEKRAGLAEVDGRLKSLLEELPDDGGERPYLSPKGKSWNKKGLEKVLKEADAGAETLAVFREALNLIVKKKPLEKEIEEGQERLQLETKAKIENLSDSEIRLLLKMKWIDPLVSDLEKLSETVLSDFEGRIETLCRKYNTPARGMEKDIRRARESLVEMLGTLRAEGRDAAGLEEFKKFLSGQ